MTIGQKCLAVSLRMTRQTYPNGAEELRDAIAQDWWAFLRLALPEMFAVPVPNIGEDAVPLLNALPVAGLLLTGGDDWGVFPQRDATETSLWTWARQHGRPVLGVCRGAQGINRLLGGSIHTGFGAGHAGTRHSVLCEPTACLPTSVTVARDVNSFHTCGLHRDTLAPGLTTWATDATGNVEGFVGDGGKVVGVLWHPEREHPAQAADLILFRHVLGGKEWDEA